MPLRSWLPREKPGIFTGFFSGGTRLSPRYTGFFRAKNPAKSWGKTGYITRVMRLPGVPSYPTQV